MALRDNKTDTDKNTNTRVPGSSDLYDIVKQSLKVVDRLTSELSKGITHIVQVNSMLAGVPMGITNQIETIVKIAASLSALSQSNLIRPNTVKNISKISDNVVDSVMIMTNTLSQIKAITLSTKLSDTIQSFAFNPVDFVKRVSSGKPITPQNESGTIEQYANIVTLIATISKFSNSIKKKSIKKSSQYIISTFKSLVKVRNYINRKSRRLRPLTAAAEKFLESLPHVWRLIIEAQNSAQQFMVNSQTISRKALRKNLKGFFSTYAYMLLYVAQIGALMLTGTALLDYKFLGLPRVKNVKISQKEMFVGLAAAAALTVYLRSLLQTAEPVFTGLVQIGSNTKAVRKGTDQFFLTYTNILLQTQVLLAHTSIKSTRERLWKLIQISAMLSAAFWSAQIMFNTLINLGKNRRIIKRGLDTFAEIFLGSEPGKIAKIFGATSQMGMIDIVNAIHITKSTKKKLWSLMLFCTAMSIVFALMNTMIGTILILASNRKVMKKGLASFKASIFEMIDIVRDKEINKLTVKDVVINCSKLALMVSGFTLIMLPMQLLGALAALSMMAIVSMWAFGHVLDMMLNNLHKLTLKKNQKNVTEGAPMMKDLILSYMGIGKILMGLGLALPAAILAIGTLTVFQWDIKLMIRNLKLVASKRNQKYISQGAPMMTLMVTAYKSWAETLKKLGDMNKALSIALLAVAAIMGFTAATTKLLMYIGDGNKNKFVNRGIRIMLSISAGLLLMAGSLYIVSLATANIEFKNILAFLGITGLIFIGYALLGLLASKVAIFMVPVLIVTAVVCASILSMAETVEKIQELDINGDKVEDNISSMLIAVTNPLIQLDGKRWIDLLRALRKLKVLKRIAHQIFKIARFVKRMANWQIEDEEGNKILMRPDDYIRATTAAQNMIGSILDIFYDPNGAETSVMIRLDEVSNSIVHKMRKMKRITRIMGRIAKLVADLAAAKVPTALDKNGVPTSWILLKDSDYENVISTGQKMIGSILDIFMDETGTPTSIMLRLDSIDNKLIRKMRKLKRITRIMGRIAILVSNMAAARVPTTFDNEGKPNAWILLKDSDYDNVITNGQKMIDSILGIFVNKDNKETNVMLRIDHVRNRLVRKMRKLKRITRILGRITDLVTKMSSMKMPDPDKGFDKDGKPNGWILLKGNFDKEVISTGQKMIDAILAIFIDPKTGNFTSTWQNMDKLKFRMTAKMVTFNAIIGNLSKITDTIIKLKSTLVPIQWDKDGNIIKYKQLTDNDFTGATTTITTIMTTLLKALGSDEIQQVINDFDKKKTKQVKALFDVMKPITSMVEAVIALSGGQVVEYDAEGHPTGKSLSIAKVLETEQVEGRISGMVTSLYKIFTDALSAISGQPENIVVESGGGFFARAWGATKAFLKNAAQNIQSVQGRINTKSITASINDMVAPIQTMISSSISISEDIGKVNVGSFDTLNTVIEKFTESMDQMTKHQNILTSMGSASISNLINNMVEISKIKDYLELCTLYPNIPVIKTTDFGTDTSVSIAISRLGKHMSEVNWKSVDGKRLGEIARNTVFFEPYLIMSETYSGISWKKDKDGTIDTAPGLAIKKLLNNLKNQASGNQVRNFRTSVDNSVKLIRSINSIDINKSDALARVLRNLYDFSRSINGNFDKLADVINEKLVTAIEKLQEVLQEVSEKEFEVTTTQVTPTPGNGAPSVANNTVPTNGQPRQDTTQRNNITKKLEEAIQKLSECVVDKKLNVNTNPTTI